MDEKAPETALVLTQADLQVALRGTVSLWASATTSESERRQNRRFYETEVSKFDGAATLYRSRSTSGGRDGETDAGGAMAETAEAALEELARPRRAAR